MPPKKCSSCNIASKYGSEKGSNPKPNNKPRSLTVTEKDLFKNHKFSIKHLNFMKTFLKAGRGCFADAHKEALKQK
tara:strand:- start:432 stop:659 length:228 start_codon:yes stop_codon:yes gene_type:complete